MGLDPTSPDVSQNQGLVLAATARPCLGTHLSKPWAHFAFCTTLCPGSPKCPGSTGVYKISRKMRVALEELMLGGFCSQQLSAGSAGAWKGQEQCGGCSGDGVPSLPAPRAARAHSQALEQLRQPLIPGLSELPEFDIRGAGCSDGLMSLWAVLGYRHRQRS